MEHGELRRFVRDEQLTARINSHFPGQTTSDVLWAFHTNHDTIRCEGRSSPSKFESGETR